MDPNTLSMIMQMFSRSGPNGGQFSGGMGAGNPMGGGPGGGGGDISTLLSGLLGNSGRPFDKGMDEYSKWMGQGISGLDPYNKAGQGAINPFQQRLGQMSDPGAFYKQMMSGYNESPLAQNQQRAATQASTNAASASGLSGSTPMMNQMQQNARDISSQDQGNYFNNLSGINQQYMGGLSGLMGNGLQAAQSQGDLYSKLAEFMGQGAAGRAGGQNQDKNNMFGGLAGLFGTAAGTMFGGPLGGMAGGAAGNWLGSMFG